LTASSSKVELLASCGSVVNVSGDLDVVGGSQASLVVCRKAPRVSAAVCGEGDTVVTSGSGGGNLAVDCGDLAGDCEDTRRTTLVLDGSVVGEVRNLDARLMTVDTSPCQAVSSAGHSDRVMAATLYACDGFSGQSLDNLRFEDDGIVFTGVVGNASLAIVVETPGPDTILVVNGKGMVVTTGDVFDGLLGQAELSRNQTLRLCALNDTTAELVLLARAPCKDSTVGVEGENMVCTAGEFGDFLQA